MHMCADQRLKRTLFHRVAWKCGHAVALMVQFTSLLHTTTDRYWNAIVGNAARRRLIGTIGT